MDFLVMHQNVHPFRIGPLCSDRVCEGDFSGDLPLPPPSSSSRTTILHLASSPPHTAAAPPIRSLPWPLLLIQLVKEPLRLVLLKTTDTRVPRLLPFYLKNRLGEEGKSIDLSAM
jgi:hypothetical protein